VKVLADTHILLWWINNDSKLGRRLQRTLARIKPDNPLIISDISLWEIATLVSLGRIEIDRSLRQWLEELCAPPLVECQRVTPAIAAEVAALPESFHRDPADRIIVATARILGATLLTHDRKIIDSKLVATLS
jgi:PIN domain nuclease of toxin-antitoxin system